MIIDKIKALSKEDFITFIDDLINYDNPEYEWQSKIEPPLPFESFEDWLFREDEEIVLRVRTDAEIKAYIDGYNASFKQFCELLDENPGSAVQKMKLHVTAVNNVRSEASE